MSRLRSTWRETAVETGKWKENDDARMTNGEGSPNVQMTEGAPLFLSSFGFRHYFVISP